MAENVRGQGNRDQKRNQENQNVNPGNRGRSQESNFNQSGQQEISSDRQGSQRGLGSQQGMERGYGNQTRNRELLEEE